jgi:hypothetical protein
MEAEDCSQANQRQDGNQLDRRLTRLAGAKSPCSCAISRQMQGGNTALQLLAGPSRSVKKTTRGCDGRATGLFSGGEESLNLSQ